METLAWLFNSASWCRQLIILQTDRIQIRLDRMLGLIWIQSFLTLRWYSRKIFLKKLILKKNSRRQKSMKKFAGVRVSLKWLPVAGSGQILEFLDLIKYDLYAGL